MFPVLEVQQVWVGVHRGEAFDLLCKASGFPRPVVVWSIGKDATAQRNLNNLPQEHVDKYTVFRRLRVENAHSEMNGTFECSACLPVENDTLNSMEAYARSVCDIDGMGAHFVVKKYCVPVLVYGEFYYTV